jgi:Ca2+-binding RTX toxin-like protein
MLRLGFLALASLCVFIAASAPASATTTKLGAVDEIRDGAPPFESSSGGDAVQISEAVGTYAVPAGYGVITAWEHRTGSASGPLHFKVYRPTGITGQFLTVASNTYTVTAGATHVFATRIPVNPGDRLGLSSLTDTTQIAYLTFNILDKFAFLPVDSNPPPGTTVMQDGPPASTYKLDVAARVESDLDRDGFGDDTQDLCPASATTRGPCKGGVSLAAFKGCSSKIANVLRGTSGANTITGTARGDRVLAGRGDDRVEGLGASDCIDLGAGTDRAAGGRGNDLVVGDSGRDRISGNSGNDRLKGSSSNDRLSGGSGRDSVNGGSGNDSIKGDSGGDRLNGSSGRDRISGGSGNDRISARDRRRDRISCGSGRDSVSADRGDRVARDCERVRRR